VLRHPLGRSLAVPSSTSKSGNSIRFPGDPKVSHWFKDHGYPSFQSWQLIPSRLRLVFSPNSGNFAATSRSHRFYNENIVYESFTGRNQTHSLVRTAFAGCNLRRTRSRSDPRASPKIRSLPFHSAEFPARHAVFKARPAGRKSPRIAVLELTTAIVSWGQRSPLSMAKLNL
jgi:hypothetical protein